MARALALLLVLTALAAPATAAAQDPFSPLPPAPQATPEPTATPEVGGQQTVSRPLLIGIAGAVLLIFVAIGVYISRDARRKLTEEDRRAVAGQGSPGDPERRAQSKAAKDRARKARQRQRQARKAQRRR